MRWNVLLLTIYCCSAYKIVIFAPDISKSQVTFNKRVAETLLDAGHDVTIALISTFTEMDTSAVKIHPNITVHRVDANVGISQSDLDKHHSSVIFEEVPIWDERQKKALDLFIGSLTKTCRQILKNKEFMNWLESEKFDLAFSHMYHTCPIGLIHAAKIPTWIWLNSGGLQDNVADLVGVPLIPSYVPPMIMGSHDTMTFFERMKSFIGHGLLKIMWPRLVANKETATFREEWDPNFPDILDLARNCPLVMVNSNELYDLPRPTLGKVINIGGIGAQLKDAKQLPENFDRILSRGEGTVIMSFGSVAAAHHMPLKWKHAFLAAFRRFPHIQFVIRYEAEDLNDRLPENVHTFKWLPQTDILQNSKTKAFITHGGYNSLQEAISAGKPMITIPLFGDQPKNSKIAEKHGIAVNLPKKDISDETVYEALREILSDHRYTANVVRLREMVLNQPFTPDEMLVRWTEFLAKFKKLDNLVPAGQKLNFFQYHSLDVMATFAGFLFILLFILYKALKCCLSCFRGGAGRKSKSE